MNRIILIGNGFDLAHGMATSYKDFIDHLWTRILDNIRNYDYQKLASESPDKETGFINLSYYNDRPINHNWHLDKKFEKATYKSLEELARRSRVRLIFTNRFLEVIIIKKESLQNWVDVENEYYYILKRIGLGKDYSRDYTIDKLNADFMAVKDELVAYLSTVTSDHHSWCNSIMNTIYTPFDFNDFTDAVFNQQVNSAFARVSRLPSVTTPKNKIDRDFINRINVDRPTEYKTEYEIKNKIRSILKANKIHDHKYFDLTPAETLFLNFNYTSTHSHYKEKGAFEYAYGKTRKSAIEIHGSLDSQIKNSVIFGFGDELDDRYKDIENLNNNAYLENIKSIKYLEKDNYKRLLEFINSDPYQILIFGHSCGLSDRTLLNTLFEHNNCASIKPYYHQLNEEEDNYGDIVRNISRHFNSKTKMRDRVVNKEYCKPLIQ